MPANVTVFLSDELKEFVDQRARDGKFSSSEEFIRHLVQDEKKRAEHERLERMLLEGLDSGPPVRATDEYWQRLHERVAGR